MWVELKDLLGIDRLPTTVGGMAKKAKLENWERRRKESPVGKVFEYHISSLPPEAQQALRFREAKALINVEQSQQQQQAQRYVSEALWQPFEQFSAAQREQAQQKFFAVVALDILLRNKMKFTTALQLVASEKGVAVGALKGWYYKVRGFDRADWLALLVKRTGKTPKARSADFDEEAWHSFLTDYLRPEQPTISACYHRLQVLAAEMGWQVPSENTVIRRLKSDVPYEVQVLKREGENALLNLVPSQRRSVSDLQAMEWLNGDGYQHNVFVRFPNGEVGRPKTWLWQDVKTRKIVGFRTDMSENSDVIRYALMDVVNKYGIPKHITIDNTRAAANKWMTGGVPNRYRFKVKPDDPKGIIPMLGIELHWTSVLAGKGHGQAKPIERAFSHGGIGELVDKDPALAGFYAGANVYDKPDNYNGGKDGVEYEVFLDALARGVALFNQKPNRNTELCQGKLSFEDVFAREYAKASVRKATKEHLRLLMLASEAVRVNMKGEFSLKAGGKVLSQENRYFAEALRGGEYKRVVVRFDPANLHQQVLVYSLDGLFICEADCIQATGFGDTKAAREQKKLRERVKKATKKVAEGLELMELNELSAMQQSATLTDALVPAPNMVELLITERNTVRKVMVEADEETQSSLLEDVLANAKPQVRSISEVEVEDNEEFETLFNRGLEKSAQ